MAGGAFATLTGLTFVAVSIHMHRITQHPILRTGCVISLSTLGTGMAISGEILVPSQSDTAIGVELLITTGAAMAFQIFQFLRAGRAHGEIPTIFWKRFPVGITTACLAVEAAVSLITGVPGGFYVLAITVGIGGAISIDGAWFFLATAEVTRRGGAESVQDSVAK